MAKIVVFEEDMLFASAYWTKKVSGIIRTLSCFSYRDASKHLHSDLWRSMSKFGLRSKSREDLNSCDTLHASRYVLTRPTHLVKGPDVFFFPSNVMCRRCQKTLWLRAALSHRLGARALHSAWRGVLWSWYNWYDRVRVWGMNLFKCLLTSCRCL